MNVIKLKLMAAILLAILAAGIVLLLLRSRTMGQPVDTMADDNGVTPAGLETVVAGSNALAAKLYGQLGAEPGNLFFSPYNIESCLALAYEGAAGSTASEMEAVLGVPQDPAVRRPAFAALHNGLNANSEFELSVANGMWGQRDYPLRPEYIELLQGSYASEADSLDFAKDSEGARHKINAWVADKTRDKIKELLAKGSLNDQTRLVLASAIYFKGQWVWKFDPGDTRPRKFSAPGGLVDVPMMAQTDSEVRLGYSETPELQALELPYEGDKLSMLLLLPRAPGLAAAEAELEPARLAALRARLKEQRVIVYLPKFKLETSYGLNEPLQALGMRAAFGSSADFSGMADTQELFIDLIVHKAYVDVYEEGTEAAAATGMGAAGGAKNPNEDPIPIFNADHPFLFIILDKQSGLVLFVGRVENPNGQGRE